MSDLSPPRPDKQDLLARLNILAVVQDLIPGGTVRGDEYHHLCPFHADKRTGNASTNAITGHGKCQSCGAGWDAFKLFMHITGTTSFHEALQGMAERYAGAATPAPRPTPPRPAAPVNDGLSIVMPIPEDAPAPPAAQHHYGRPTTQWAYRDHTGEVLGHVYRFDRPEKRKEILPLTLWMDQTGQLCWKWRHFPEPRPLYGLDRLQRIIDLTPTGEPVQILFFEGEKAADAGHDFIGDRYACMTWPAGSNAIEDKDHQCKIDLAPCRGRDCVIWPDADTSGLKAADTLARHLRRVGASSITILTPPEDKGDGWDIADGKAEGWTVEQVFDYIASSKRIEAAIPPDGSAVTSSPSIPMEESGQDQGQTVKPLFDLSRLTLGGDIAAGDYQLNYLVDKLIPEQAVILFYAKGGAGKSTLATQIAGAVVKGLPFMGLPTVKRPVVIIDFENPNAVLKKRIKAVPGSNQVYFWTGSNSPPQLNKNDWIILKDMAMTLDNPLIFIDTLSSATSGLDILSNGDYAKVMSKILELRNLGATIVLLHHTPKGDATQYIGASVIYNQCDHILAMYPVKAPGTEKEVADEDEAKTYRLGTKDKTRFEPFSMFIEFDEELCTFVPARDPDSDTLDKLKSIIAGLAPNATQSAIVGEAKERGLPEKRIRRLLHNHEGRLWGMTPGLKNAKVYHLNSVWQFGSPIYGRQTAKQESTTESGFAKQGQTVTSNEARPLATIEFGSLASNVSPDCQTEIVEVTI